jgi:hypothetical protein
MPTVPPRIPDERILKRQAKALLRAVRAGDHEARQRFLAHGQQFESHDVRLAQALFVIAREQGFASWPKLKAHVAMLHVVSQQRRQQEAARLARKSMREKLTTERASILIASARTGASEQMAALFGRLPRRDIEAVRAALLARDDDSYNAVVTTLIAGLRHPDSRVRYGCAGALDHFGDIQADAPLRVLLDDPVPRVRRMALHALSCDACKLESIPHDHDLVVLLARHALHDSSINVRRHAAYALVSRQDDPQATAAIDQLWREETDPVIQRTLRRALGDGNGPPVPV